MDDHAVARHGEVVQGEGDPLQRVGQLVQPRRVGRPAEAR
jgi:hypothetical protein